MKKFIGFERGINFGGWFSQCQLDKEHLETFITEKDFLAVKSMGADHIRLPIDYSLIETEDGKHTENGYSYIDRCVSYCKKYGLNMILDLHSTFGYSFDKAEDCRSFWKSTECQKRFLSLWDKLAARYGKLDFIAFDLLNEIVDSSVTDIWNRLALNTIERIRRFSNEVPILVGGTRYNSIFTVKDILPPPDDNIVYSFHFYEPYIFTHQGAEWEPTMKSDFRVSYPLAAGEYINVSKSDLGGQCSGIFYGMNESLTGKQMLSELFSEAVLIAEQRNVPLYCGEYGVIDNANPECAVSWFRDINDVFNHYRIGRALWTYKGMNFGITDEHYRSVFSRIKDLL